MATKEFDILLWGVTGWTGLHLLEYFAQNYPLQEDGVTAANDLDIKWGIVARSPEKLQKAVDQVSQEFNVPWLENVPRFHVSNDGSKEMNEAVAKAKVVATVVGPYARYGEELVKACVQNGTHYCDITGEVHFIRKMMDKYEKQAMENNVLLVPFSGIDCVPSDCAVLKAVTSANEEISSTYNLTPEEMIAVPKSFRMKGYVTKMEIYNRTSGSNTSVGGGTIASVLEMAESKSMRGLSKPYLLTGPDDVCIADKNHKPSPGVRRESRLKSSKWTALSPLAMGNEMVVRRSRYMLPETYGADLSYHETMAVSNPFLAIGQNVGLAMFFGLIQNSFLRNNVVRRFVPQPSQFPPPYPKNFKPGAYEIVVISEADYDVSKVRADAPKDVKIKSRVTWSMPGDPGYTETSKMLAEVAIMLARKEEEIREISKVSGGFVTPACLGETFVKRLQAKDVAVTVENI